MMKQENFLSLSHRHPKPHNRNGKIEILLSFNHLINTLEIITIYFLSIVRLDRQRLYNIF